MWEGKRLTQTQIFKPLPGEQGKFEDRISSIIRQVRSHCGAYRYPEFVWAEGPNFFDSDLGQTAARSGDLMKLLMAAGAVAGFFMGEGVPYHIVPVTTWLGQLKQRMVVKRIRRVLHPEEWTLATRHMTENKSEDHALYAVGVGLWHLGKF